MGACGSDADDGERPLPLALCQNSKPIAATATDKDLVELEQMPARRLETPRRVVSETKALLAVHGLIGSAVGPRQTQCKVVAPRWRWGR